METPKLCPRVFLCSSLRFATVPLSDPQRCRQRRSKHQDLRRRAEARAREHRAADGTA